MEHSAFLSWRMQNRPFWSTSTGAAKEADAVLQAARGQALTHAATDALASFGVSANSGRAAYKALDMEMATTPSLEPTAPRSNHSCPAATRCRAAAFKASSLASSCSDPSCSVSLEPPRRLHDLDRGRPETVFTVPTCATR